MGKERFPVEVAYALAKKQLILSLEVEEGTTLREAIVSSGIQEQFPEIDLTTQKVGIFSKTLGMEQILQPGDRVEIYRPLLADPKEVRRQRAMQAKKTVRPSGS